MVELRESIRLLAGRAYPIRLEFFKSKEAKEKTASVALEWKPPFGVDGPIPARNLSPNRFPETLVVTTAFPPDDRSLGWERGTTISKAWDQAATDAALETAAYVTAHLRELADVREDAKDRGPKLREFCRRFAERLPPAAHRRAEETVHRSHLRHGPRPGRGRQARRAAGAAVAAISVPGSRRRPRGL